MEVLNKRGITAEIRIGEVTALGASQDTGTSILSVSVTFPFALQASAYCKQDKSLVSLTHPSHRYREKVAYEHLPFNNSQVESIFLFSMLNELCGKKKLDLAHNRILQLLNSATAR